MVLHLILTVKKIRIQEAAPDALGLQFLVGPGGKIGHENASLMSLRIRCLMYSALELKPFPAMR
jgi:hypothetical protein